MGGFRDEGEGVWVRKADASAGFGTLAMGGDGGMDLEGGKEFRSGIAEGLSLWTMGIVCLGRKGPRKKSWQVTWRQ